MFIKLFFMGVYLYCMISAQFALPTFHAVQTTNKNSSYFSAISLANDNTSITITFSGEVYNTTGGSGALEANDFNFTLIGGNATLSSSTPSSISASGNDYTLGIPAIGAGNGSELLIVNPVSSSIYDELGNEVSAHQAFNSVILNDRLDPTFIISAKNSSEETISDGSTTNDNALEMTFFASEPLNSLLAVTDITVSGGSLSSFTTGSSGLSVKGSTISGEAAGDESGYSAAISGDGLKIAVGARYNDATASNAGHVRVYSWNGTEWSQVGNDIDGEAGDDQYGFSLDINGNGNRVIIGGPQNDGNGSNSGHVRIFDWNGSAWVQVGSDIDGEAAGDQFGTSVSIDGDGDRIAVGGIGNDATASNAGHVRVYFWDGISWIQLGDDLDGETRSDNFGNTIELDIDGDRLAIGGAQNNGTGPNAGHVRVFNWSGNSWDQLGSDIDGEASGDLFGSSVAINSSGNRIAVGAANASNGSINTGHVRVYDWDGSSWNQLGGDIDGEADEDLFGGSISLNAIGSRVFIGAIDNDGGGDGAGHVRAYDWDGSSWNNIGEFDGLAANDDFGKSVDSDASGSVLIISAPRNDTPASENGLVVVADIILDQEYTATFTPSSDGATTIDIAAGVSKDYSGNNNTAADQFNWTYDSTAPTITSSGLVSDNSAIAVTFSEAVYNTNGGSGSLQVSDFVLSISGGSATLSSTTPSSISVSSNTYTLGISLSGTPNGAEAVTVNPANNSIFDFAGNVASTSQSNNTDTLKAVNYVLDLNGFNEAAYVNDDPAFETTDLSIQAWVDPSSLPSSGDQAWFINKNRAYRIGLENIGGTTKIISEFRDGSGNYEDLQGTTLSDVSGGWYHVVFTFDDSLNRIRLYVNGSQVAFKSHNSSTVNNNSPLSIGRRADTDSGYYGGKIDEVAYWNTELSAEAITALYNSGTPLSASSNSGNYTNSGNLVMYYQFQGNLNDSEGSFDLTNYNDKIGPSNYVDETIE